MKEKTMEIRDWGTIEARRKLNAYEVSGDEWKNRIYALSWSILSVIRGVLMGQLVNL